MHGAPSPKEEAWRQLGAAPLFVNIVALVPLIILLLYCYFV